MQERSHQTLIRSLSHSLRPDQSDWNEQLAQTLFAYRTTKHRSTSFSPFFLMYGRLPRLPLDSCIRFGAELPISDLHEYSESLVARLREAWLWAKAESEFLHDQEKQRYDLKASKELEVGDKVCLLMPIRKKGLSPKLSFPYRGVYVVEDVHPGAQNAKIKAYGKEDAPVLRVNIRRLKRLVSDFPVPQRTQMGPAGTHACGSRRNRIGPQRGTENNVKNVNADSDGKAAVPDTALSMRKENKTYKLRRQPRVSYTK